ncbi:MAG: hypothetical protein ACREX9_15595, partial [Gammaproteobacteria bacterium]
MAFSVAYNESLPIERGTICALSLDPVPGDGLGQASPLPIHHPVLPCPWRDRQRKASGLPH